jgi:DNA polymerase V
MLFTLGSEGLPGFNPAEDLAGFQDQQRLALVDCNQFYVSCERLFRPDLRSRAVVVLSNNDGCVIALSPEARALGITMGQPWFEVRQRFARALPVAFSSNYTLYEAISERVMASLRSFGHPTEVYSIDEAFLQLPCDFPPELQAAQLVERVERWTGIPVRAGLGSTKSLAKAASWLAKKRYGRPWHILSDPEELSELPIEAVWGIGPQHAARLQARGVFTAAEFIRIDPVWIRKQMTIQGLKLYLELQGIAWFEFQSQGRRQRQIRHARSLAYDQSNLNTLSAWLAGFVVQAALKLRRQDLLAGRLGVYLQTNRFRSQAEAERDPAFVSRRLEAACNYTPQLLKTAQELLVQLYLPGRKYKKLGVLLDELSPRQETALSWLYPDQEKDQALMHSIDSLNQQLGYQAVFYGRQLGAGPYSRQENRSPRYLTAWQDLPEISPQCKGPLRRQNPGNLQEFLPQKVQTTPDFGRKKGPGGVQSIDLTV